jgi:hypothetical protein
MKRILIVAFHFPPSSGAAVQRVFSLCDDLYDFDWEPLVLTARSSAYDGVEFSQKVPDRVQENVVRAIAFDVFRHLSIKGKHFGALAALDRWTSWIFDAIYEGRKIIEKQRPDIIMSTTPIPSANIIAHYLSKKFSIPWVSDYQDPLSYHYAELGGLEAKMQKYVDNLTIKHCAAAIFATENAKDSYIQKFGEKVGEKFHVVENGYVEENWEKVKTHSSSGGVIDPNKTSLFYSGVLYPDGRDPSNLFKAIRSLKINKIIDFNSFELVFQGVHEEGYSNTLRNMDIDDLVKFTPAVPYLDSLACMRSAQILLVIQGDIFNLQVPGKIYEYIRAGKPILTLTPFDSATAKVAKKYPGGYIAEEEKEIERLLERLIKDGHRNYDYSEMTNYSRHQKNKEFVAVFNEITKCNV